MTNAERLCANKAELAQACGMLCQRIESCWACPLIYFCKGTMRGVYEAKWRQWMEEPWIVGQMSMFEEGER